MNCDMEVVYSVNNRMQCYDTFLKEFREGFRLIAGQIVKLSDLMDQRCGELGQPGDGIANLKKALGIKL